MYKLENNVEWTEDLKNAFKHNVTRAKIIYDNIELNYDNGIKEITLEDNVYVPDLGFIGQAVAKKVILTLLDNEQTTNLENKEFELYIGADYNGQTYYINYGNFIVNEAPENDSTNGTIKVIAYDYMIKFNKIYEDQVVYPLTLKNYLLNICQQAGVELGTQSFANDSFLVTDNQFEGKQLREVLKHIGKCAFSWVRIGQDNKLYLDFENTEIEKYQVVDYIESIGTQYIDTGITANGSNTNFEIDFIPTDLTPYEALISARKSTSENRFDILWGYDTIYIGYGNSSSSINNSLVANTRYKLVKNGNDYSLNNIKIKTITPVSFETPVNMVLFANNTNGTIANYCKVKMYSCKIYDNATLVRNYIPCKRKSDNVLGLYDLVTNTFFTNQGTGTFIAGNDIEGRIIYQGVTETFTIDDYKMDGYKKANEYYGPINKVTYGDSDIQGQEISVPSVDPQNVKELVINDNYFGYTLEKRNQLIQAGTSLFGFTYMPVSQLDLTGAIYLDCTDSIEVQDEDENSIITRVFSHTIKYNGIISDSITTEGISDNQQTYENMNMPVSATNRTEISVDRANKRIQSIVSEIGDRSQKTTTITQDIDGIESLVQDIEDLTDTAEGLKTVTISDAYPGANILELHIYGNNQVFQYLYPADDLFPYGDARIRFHNDNEDRTIDLGIDEVLRANTEVRDEVFIENTNVYLIRRVNADGTTKSTEESTLLGHLSFVLQEGDNTFEIVNYSAPIAVKYATKNDFTDIFATKAEMSSSITQTATEINLQVSKKVDENEVISKINQSAEQIQIEADKISLSGKTLNLADNMAIVSNNFNVDKYGNIRCKNADFEGGYVNLYRDNTGIATLTIASDRGDSPDYISRFWETGFNVWSQDNEVASLGVAFNGQTGEEVGGSLSVNDLQHVSSDYSGVQIDGYDYGSVVLMKNGSSTINLQGSNGRIVCVSLTQTSLEENKENFEKLENALEIVKNTDIYKYNLKIEDDKSKKHIGFVIGDKYNYSKEITSLENDGVDIYSMVSVAYKAIQEQQEQIEKLEQRIKELEDK